MAGLQRVKSIPEEILHQMPAETISVPDLLAANLPRSLRGVIHLPESCLSKQISGWAAEYLWKARVSPREWLSSLNITWIAGGPARSIRSRSHGHIAGSKDLRFPFWIWNGRGDRAEREVAGMDANVMRRFEAKYIH